VNQSPPQTETPEQLTPQQETPPGNKSLPQHILAPPPHTSNKDAWPSLQGTTVLPQTNNRPDARLTNGNRQNHTSNIHKENTTSKTETIRRFVNLPNYKKQN